MARVSANVKIWTDGSSTGRVGAGGWAAAVCRFTTNPIRKIGEVELNPGGYELRLAPAGGLPRGVTNNQMEVMAAVAGLRAVAYPERCPYGVEVLTDSEYVQKGHAEGRWDRAAQKGWPEKVKNREWLKVLHQEIRRVSMGVEAARIGKGLPSHIDPVRFRWVKGHGDDYYNVFADELAVTQRRAAEKTGHVVLHDARFEGFVPTHADQFEPREIRALATESVLAGHRRARTTLLGGYPGKGLGARLAVSQRA